MSSEVVARASPGHRCTLDASNGATWEESFSFSRHRGATMGVSSCSQLHASSSCELQVSTVGQVKDLPNRVN